MPFSSKINTAQNKNIFNNTSTEDSYDNLLNGYKNFIKTVEKSDFANSPTRYIVELEFTEELIKLSKEKNKDTELWQNKEKEIHKKLAEFNVKIKKQ